MNGVYKYLNEKTIEQIEESKRSEEIGQAINTFLVSMGLIILVFPIGFLNTIAGLIITGILGKVNNDIVKKKREKIDKEVVFEFLTIYDNMVDHFKPIQKKYKSVILPSKNEIRESVKRLKQGSESKSAVIFFLNIFKLDIEKFIHNNTNYSDFDPMDIYNPDVDLDIDEDKVIEDIVSKFDKFESDLLKLAKKLKLKGYDIEHVKRRVENQYKETETFVIPSNIDGRITSRFTPVSPMFGEYARYDRFMSQIEYSLSFNVDYKKDKKIN